MFIIVISFYFIFKLWVLSGHSENWLWVLGIHIKIVESAHAPGTSEVGAPVGLDHLALGVEIAPEHVSASVSSLQNASNHCSSITANQCK